MAITDVRILRSLRITESKSDKQTIQLSATQELLFISNTKDPAFNDVLEDTAVWTNLGNAKVPQINDYVFVKGIQLYVTSRDVSYYKDNERAVVMTVKYDAKAPEDSEPPKPDETDAETWQRITVSSQQVTKPALGFDTRAAVPAENASGVEKGARNSAGDPIDGLEEESSLVKLTYTNTQVASPNFQELLRYSNRCNDGSFLGGPDYTVRMVGWNAEYDQKNNVWSVSVEFLYNPDGWQIVFYDAGFNKIESGQRKAILDVAGNPVSQPVPLNNAGGENTIGNPPYTRELYPYKIANMASLFANCGI